MMMCLMVPFLLTSSESCLPQTTLVCTFWELLIVFGADKAKHFRFDIWVLAH